METAVKTTDQAAHTPKQNRALIGGPEYSIYNFFRRNTGFAIAVISGIAAVSSFVFRYASTLYHYAYLRFWDIDIAYARQEDSGIFYTALGVFLYHCLTTFSQYLFGQTIAVYICRNERYLAMKVMGKQIIKKKKVNQRIKQRLCKQLKKEAILRRRDRLTTRISKADSRIIELDKLLTPINILSSGKCILVFKALGSLLLPLLLCAGGAVILAFNYGDGVKEEMFWILLVVPMVLSLLMVILQKRPKIANEQDLKKALDHYLTAEKEEKAVLFPVEAWAKKGIKHFFTNRTLGAMFAQYVLTILLCVMLLFATGRADAEGLHEFRVWSDGDTTYAIIYDNGTQVIMEPICIQGEHAIINTSSQRILQSDDLSYQIYTFDTIEIIRYDSNETTQLDSASHASFPPSSTS